MAATAQISGLFSWYTHILTVWIISQDTNANTTKLGYAYDVRREPSPSNGAWTTLNSVTFHAVINGVDHADNPDFDFRGGGFRTIRMLQGEQTVTMGTNGSLSVPISFSCNALGDPDISKFPAASGSGTFVLNSIPRASTFTVTPNPVTTGDDVTIAITRASTSFTHDITWTSETDSGTIATASATGTTWTVDTDILDSDPSTVIEIKVVTKNGATVIGSSTKDLTIKQPPSYPTIGVGTPYDIRFRRTVIDGSNWETREAIPFIEASFTDTNSATGTCEITVPKGIYETDLDKKVVALDVFDGSQWIDFGARYVLLRVEGDKANITDTVTYTGTAYVDYLLGKALVMPEAEWVNATPGQIIGSHMNLAQARGWGTRVSRRGGTPNTAVGTPWANTTNMNLSRGMPISQVLESLVNDVLVEYRTSFSANKCWIDLYNPGYGADWTVRGADPIVNLATASLYKNADKAPVRKDYSDMLTRVNVQGDEAVRVRERAASVDSLFGHLEGSVAATGIADPAYLDRLGDAALAINQAATVERTFSYDLSSNEVPASVLPYRTFRPGDWILVPGDDAPVRARVSQVAITRNADGTQATITVGDMIPSGLAATARRLTQQSSGAIAGGTGQSQASLKRSIPAAPQNVVGTEDGYWDITGQPRGSVLLEWDAVTLSLENSTLAVDLYEIWTREEIGSPWVLSFLSDTNSVVMAPLRINYTFDVQVRARSVAGVYGEYSDLITVVTPEPDEILPAPSDPILEANALGTVAVTWDGYLDGDLPPLWFSYLRAEISDAEAGAYSVAGTQLTQAGTISVPQVGSGTWWFRLVPVDRLGNDGDYSDPVSIVVEVTAGDTRKPKAPTGLAVTSLGYWSGSAPESSIMAAWDAVTEAEDDDSPIDIRVYEVWGRLDTDLVPHLLASTEATSVTISPIGPIGSEWQIKVRAVATNNEQGEFSAEEPVVVEMPDLVLDVPTPPILNSWAGLILVSWDGNLVGVAEDYPAPALIAHVDVEVSIDDGDTWRNLGFLTTGARTISIAGVDVGADALVRLIAVDRLGQATTPSAEVPIVVIGIDGADVQEGTMAGNRIIAGSISTNLVEPGFGNDLDISANDTVSIIAGQVADVSDGVDANADAIAEQRTRYDFTPTEAIISQPGSPFQVSISNTQMEFREAGVARAFLNAGVFNAPKMASTQLVLQYHVIEDDPEGTVIRRL